MKTIPQDLRPAIAMLIFAAESERTMSYTQFGRLFNRSARGHGIILEAVNGWCRQHDVPQLAVLVVEKSTELPVMAGYTGPAYRELYPDWDERRVRVEQVDCFMFAWDVWLKSGETLSPYHRDNTGEDC